MINIIIIIIIK